MQLGCNREEKTMGCDHITSNKVIWIFLQDCLQRKYLQSVRGQITKFFP
jgi:hypothetical protein